MSRLHCFVCGSLVFVLCLLDSFDDVQTSKKESGVLSDYLFRETFKARNSKVVLQCSLTPRALKSGPARRREMIFSRFFASAQQ